MSTEVSGNTLICQRPFPVSRIIPWPALAGRFLVPAIIALAHFFQPVIAAVSEPSQSQDQPAVFETLITPQGSLRIAQDVSIIMRDDTLISLDVYRPDDNTSHPVLYAAGPYSHTRDILNDPTTTAGPVSWYVSQGYIVVLASVRGTGLSTGDYTFLSRQEQQDHYEIVQWITGQPWSNGQVAGFGAGYYAAAQWQLAIQNPPGLACIAPINGTLDPYREWVAPGGLANDPFISGWYESQVRLPNAFAPDAPRLLNYDLRLAWLMHPLYDDYWRERSSRENTNLINVPIFAIHDWNQNGEAAGFTTTLNSLGRLNVVNKLMVSSPPGDLPLYQDTDFLARELLPYYQWCFSGKPSVSPYIERPRVQYVVRGQNNIKRESNWPPGNITHQAWFPSMPDNTSIIGSLSDSQPNSIAGFTNLDRTRANTTLQFISAPLQQDMEITGPAMMELYAATTGNDMAFEVTIKEQVPFQVPASVFLLEELFDDLPGESVSAFDASTDILVTRGKLKASVRQRDDTRSSEYLPVYRLDEKQTLSPGQVYRLDIAMRQTAYRFRAGSRIVLEVKPVNDGSLARTGRDTVYHNTRYPTRLWLPVVQGPQSSPQLPTNSNNSPARRLFPFEVERLENESGNSLDEQEPEVNESPAIFVPL